MQKKEKIKVVGSIFKYTVDFFHEKGFVQLMPVMLGKSVDPLGPDPGSSVIAVPEIEYQGEVLRMTTSMILHKQVAVKELGRIFIMSPNIRLEHPKRKHTGRHLFEFTQADFEIAHAKTDDVIELIEEYYTRLTRYLKDSCAECFEVLGVDVFEFRAPFKRYTTHELMEYGEDWEKEASLLHKQPFWVLCHKREFYDKEDVQRPGHYLNYDLIYPLGYGEGISGAEREHEYERIVMRIKRDGIPIEKYKAYLECAKKGFVPSAGAGIGMERLARFLTRSEHVADVQAFERVPGKPVII